MHFRFAHRFSIVGLSILAAVSACNSTDTTSTMTTTPPPASVPATETYAPSLGVNIAAMTKVNDNLYIKDLTTGTGVVTFNNHPTVVTYTGRLTNGTQFDSNTTAPFLLGTGAVIAGWDQGLLGMRVGGKRLLVIGSTLGYGPVPNGSIPPSSTLVFMVELKSVQ
jgi:FKBP-type peptidyl-prolyl cis-trans isomerase FkpA